MEYLDFKYTLRIVLHFFLITLINISCNKQKNVQEKYNTINKKNEKAIDSIYEQFEEITYNNKERYISNPDSFVNTLKLEPSTLYQKELFNYGLIFIGYGLLENGDIYESIKYYEKAYDYAKKENVTIDDINSTIIKPLSNLYTRINDTEKAINLIKTTLKEDLNQDQRIALNNNLANAYIYNNQIDLAEKLLLETVTKTDNSKQLSLLFNSLSTVYNEKKDRSNSIKYNKLAISSFEKENLKEDTLLWYVSALGMHSQLTNSLQSSQKALEIIENEFPKTQNRLKAKLLSIEAEILHSNNNPDELTKHNEIINLFNTDQLKNTLDYTYTNSLFGKAKFFKTHSQLDSSLLYYELGIENDFKTQQLITSPKDQIRNNLLNKEIVSELIELIDNNESLKSNPIVLKQLLWCIELSKARLLINEINRSDQWNNANSETKAAVNKIQILYQQKDEAKDFEKKQKLQNEINQLQIAFQLSEKYFETLRFSPNKNTFFSNLNLPNTDFFSYHIHPDNKVSIIHKSDDQINFYQITDSLFVANIDSFKKEYFGSSPNNYNSNPKKYKDSSSILVNKLLADLKNTNVYVSLDGNLYGLPFDALYNNDFLVNQHNFAYLNSFLLFDILEANQLNEHPVSLLFRSEYKAPLPSLSFVKKEVDNISKTFLTEKIEPQQQTNEVLKLQFAKSNIIHIAAHTILDSTNAPEIYLKNPISTNQIRYFEIKSPLVFLSACNTGKGESLPSEGMESIQRVFLSKNVPSVISTYWFANDETMLKITDDFYKILYQTQNPILSLAEAKRHYLLKANAQHQNPWYWANINYSGIGNEIGLKKSSNLFIVISILGISSILYVMIKLIKIPKRKF